MHGAVLLVDDDVDLCELIATRIEASGHTVLRAHSAEDGLRALAQQPFDVVITDMTMQGMTGIELCEAAHELHQRLPVIVMTAYGTVESAIAAMRSAAYDFVTKPFDVEHLALVVERALALAALHGEVDRLQSIAGTPASTAPEIVGNSPAIEEVRSLISRVADMDSTVLITGESGTGKELIARALHEASPRKNGRFVAINCAAMPESLLESELFGHSRGAFTDAHHARDGLLVQATRGTLLLDEVGEMPLGMQAKLLRTLQERRVRPVGSDVEMAFDARIIAATHRDLEAQVRAGRFREDLYYRVNVVRIHAPPLRARGNDVLLLAQQFLERLVTHSRMSSQRDVRGMSAAVASKLLAFPWPGNVRELQNCVERALVVAQGKEIRVEDLPATVLDYEPSVLDPAVTPASVSPLTMPTMEQIEARYIHQVLSAAEGNKTLAAQILGIDRRTLYRKLGS